MRLRKINLQKKIHPLQLKLNRFQQHSDSKIVSQIWTQGRKHFSADSASTAKYEFGNEGRVHS